MVQDFWLVFAGVAIGWIFFGLWSKRRGSPEKVDWQTGQTHYLLQEMRDLGEALTSDLERRAVQLNQLLDRADQTIERLEASTVGPQLAPRAPQELTSVRRGLCPVITLPPRTTEIHVEDQRNTRVAAMAQQGYSVTDIAKSMKIGQGEVRLILDLPHHGN